MTVLGVDPGTRKCGFAVIDGPSTRPAALGIVPLEGFAARVKGLALAHRIGMVAIGQGTNATDVAAMVTAAGLPHAFVDERETTLQARARFFDDHPPRGWRRFVPRGMLLPDRPVDDYAALLIAERYLRLVE